jgi:uncharacterized protein (TIGR03435 family)
VNVLIAVDYGERSALLDSQIAGAPSIIHTLLPDRFKLNIHKETRQMPVYDLVLASADGRLGPRLTNPPGTCVRVSGALPPNIDFSTLCGFKGGGPTRIRAMSIDLDSFAGELSRRPDVGRLVRNRTGPTTEFDLELEYAPLAAAGDRRPVQASRRRCAISSAFRFARDEPAPVEVHVVDSLERPTPD